MNLRDIVLSASLLLAGCSSTLPQSTILSSRKGVFEQASYELSLLQTEDKLARELTVDYNGRTFYLHDVDCDDEIDYVTTHILGIEFSFPIDSPRIDDKTRNKIKEIYRESLKDIS